MCWKHSSKILVSAVPPHSKGALLCWDLMVLEAIWVLTVIFSQPNRGDLSFVIWCDQPSEDGYTVIIKGWAWSAATDAQLVLRGPNCSQQVWDYTTTSLNSWYKAEWTCPLTLFTPNSDLTIWILQEKSRPGNSFLLLCWPILVSPREL